MRLVGCSFTIVAVLTASVSAAAQDVRRESPPFDAQRMMQEQAASTRKANEAAEAKRKAAEAAAKAKSPCAIKGGVRVGMTRAEVYASCWGKPQKINVTTTAGGDFEQLVYGGFQYLYLKNGIVTSIQTSR